MKAAKELDETFGLMADILELEHKLAVLKELENEMEKDEYYTYGGSPSPWDRFWPLYERLVKEQHDKRSKLKKLTKEIDNEIA